MCNMKYGKISDFSKVNFTLPENTDFTNKLLSKIEGKKEVLNVYSGCTGWSMKEWVGNYYPLGTRSNDFLTHYSRQFNTIELNTTYYRIPDLKTVQKWVSQTPENFRFAPKIPQIISHQKQLSLRESYIEQFCEAVSGLGNRLGISFLQLPPNFGPADLSTLECFLKRFPIEAIPLSVEIRNEIWLNDNTEINLLNEMLEHYGAGTVMSDVAGNRAALHMNLCNETVMIRFVGNELDTTDFSRLDDWVLRLKNWIESGIKTIYFFHHQEENMLAPEICSYFNKKMNELCDCSLIIPKKYNHEQLSLF